jgi:hypothetical protein
MSFIIGLHTYPAMFRLKESSRLIRKTKHVDWVESPPPSLPYAYHPNHIVKGGSLESVCFVLYFAGESLICLHWVHWIKSPLHICNISLYQPPVPARLNVGLRKLNHKKRHAFFILYPRIVYLSMFFFID